MNYVCDVCCERPCACEANRLAAERIVDKAAAFNEVGDSLAACLRVVDGLELLLMAARWQSPPSDKAFGLLEDKTTILAKAKEVSARAAKIGGE